MGDLFNVAPIPSYSVVHGNIRVIREESVGIGESKK